MKKIVLEEDKISSGNLLLANVNYLLKNSGKEGMAPVDGFIVSGWRKRDEER